jgi:hypothetical protein
VLGSKRFVENLELNDQKMGTYISAGHTHLLHRVLWESGFDKEIIYLNAQIHAGSGVSSLAGVWPYLDHPSFRKLNLVDMDHAPQLNNTMALSTTETGTRIGSPGPLSILSNVTELRLVGCKGDSSCVADTETFSILVNSRFPHLVRLQLIGYVVTGQQLIAFLGSVNSTVKDVSLNNIHLTTSSWKRVLPELHTFRRLRGLIKVQALSETIRYASGRFEKVVVIE